MQRPELKSPESIRAKHSRHLKCHHALLRHRWEVHTALGSASLVRGEHHRELISIKVKDEDEYNTRYPPTSNTETMDSQTHTQICKNCLSYLSITHDSYKMGTTQMWANKMRFSLTVDYLSFDHKKNRVLLGSWFSMQRAWNLNPFEQTKSQTTFQGSIQQWAWTNSHP